MSKPKYFAAVSCSALALIQPANAEESEKEGAKSTGESPQIVVLGTRHAAADPALSSGKVTEIMSPSSRSVERDVLDSIGADRLSDALDLISGVSNQNNRGGVMDNFAIRGFLGTPDGGAEYYVDGFLANRGMAPPRDPATTERVELLKGPSGALFGDIDPGGRINIISKTPSFAPHIRADLSYGSYDTRRVMLDANAPFTSNLAGRIVMAKEKSDGWRDHVTLDRLVIAPSLTWRMGDDIRLTYVGEITRFDTPFDRGMPAINGDANTLPASRYFGEPGNGDTHFRNQRHQLTILANLSENWTVNGGIAWRKGTLKGFSADQSRLVDGHILWRQRRQRNFAVDDLSARMEITGIMGQHRVSFGAKGYLLDYDERWMRRNPSATNPYAIDVYNPVYGGGAADLLPFTQNKEKRRAATFYVQDYWEATDRLSISGGVRYDPYRQQIHNLVANTKGITKDDPWHFRLGGRYALTDAIALHANWGESFVLNSGTDRNGSGFAPESGKGYELGVSARMKGIDVALTWFDISKRNILTNDPVDPNYLAPVGSLSSKGIELDVSAKIGTNWQVIGNYAWTNAKADDSAFATDAVLNVPEHSGSLFIIGTFRDADGRGPAVSAGVRYVGDRPGAIDTSGLILPDYVTVKGAVDYSLSRSLTLRLEADNLLNTRYADSSYSPLWIFPGTPRTIKGTIRITI